MCVLTRQNKSQPLKIILTLFWREVTPWPLLRSKSGERNHNLVKAEKISILWLIQIDAILDLSERVWVLVQEPSRSSFPEDRPRAKTSALQRKFHHYWGKFSLFFRRKCHFFLGKCTFETPKPKRVQKAKFSSSTSRKCYERSSCFGLPKSAIENSVGIDLKGCTLTGSGFKVKEKEI